ncbi:hypothetical protein KSP35_07330 [Aquihabitans sp. G128]|uniref:hypothetical protein n=1 Tax=Aquihabitans sp. G128 TaxID=2849779 RepID=UPI001C248D83|nr:hypothetical protein [Aquihabitans sp. G128]QXC62599.1 hypothetical protein KSP35_07330 [Aquihabitans sp. G128]
MPDLPPPPASAVGGPPPARLPAPPVGARAPEPPRAWRRAPVAFVLLVASVPLACWFSTWGIDGVNHCDDPSLTPEQSCGLGFAVLLPVAWLFSVGVGLGAGALAVLRVPRWVAWSVCLAAIAAMWGANLAALSAYQPRR